MPFILTVKIYGTYQRFHIAIVLNDSVSTMIVTWSIAGRLVQYLKKKVHAFNKFLGFYDKKSTKNLLKNMLFHLSDVATSVSDLPT